MTTAAAAKTTSNPGSTVLSGAGAASTAGATGAPADGAPPAGGSVSPPADPPASPPADSPEAKAAAEKKAADDKAAADKLASEKAAEIELKLPDAIKDEPVFAKFKEVAKELGLKSEAAQKVVDFYLEQQKAGEANQVAQLETMQKGWEAELKADKELGGANFKQAAETAYRAIKKFGDAETEAWLEETKLGNNPKLVRMFHRIGKAMAEDSIGGAGSGAPNANDPQARLRIQYPSMFKE